MSFKTSGNAALYMYNFFFLFLSIKRMRMSCEALQIMSLLHLCQEMYLRHMIRSMLKQLQLGESDQTLLTFVDRAMRSEERKKLLESHYSQELSLLYILQEDYDRAKYYTNCAMQLFMEVCCHTSFCFICHQVSVQQASLLMNSYFKGRCASTVCGTGLYCQSLCLTQSYSSVDTLLTQSRLTILQSVQALTEIQDFLLFMKGEGAWMLSLKHPDKMNS